MNAIDKIVDGLKQLLSGFSQLEDNLESDFGSDPDEEGFSAAIFSEMLAAIETVIDNEDYTPEYIASLVSAMIGALEEMDPDIFNEEDQNNDEDDLDDDYGDEDDPYGYDD